MDAPTDQQVEAYIDSVPGLRREWGIIGANRTARLTLIIMSLCLLGIAAGAVLMLLFEDNHFSTNEVTGILIVIVLTYVACGMRFFQLRSERADLVRFRQALAKRLTGNPQTDTDAQTQAEVSFKWTKGPYKTIINMIGIAGFVILTLNTYQSGEILLSRMLLFDACILAFLAGMFWNNFAFKADLLEVELEERSRATIKWQSEHPGEAQRQQDEAQAAKEEAANGGLHGKHSRK